MKTKRSYFNFRKWFKWHQRYYIGIPFTLCDTWAIDVHGSEVIEGRTVKGNYYSSSGQWNQPTRPTPLKEAELRKFEDYGRV